MNWSDERYVKLYVRNTAAWVLWPWQSRCLFPLLLRVADGSGLIDCGRRDRAQGIAALTAVPIEVVEPALAGLLEDGTIEAVDGGVLIPKFIEAQETRQTPAARKRAQRERDRIKVRENTKDVTRSHTKSPQVTRRHIESPPVTTSHTESQSVTLSSAQLSSAQLFAGHEAVPPAPKPKREPSAAEAFWVWGQDQADNQRPGRVRSAPEPKKLNALLKAPLTQVGRKGLELAWGRYLADPYAAERDWPLELFVSKFSALHNAAAAQPQTREEPKCVVLNPRIATR